MQMICGDGRTMLLLTFSVGEVVHRRHLQCPEKENIKFDGRVKLSEFINTKSFTQLPQRLNFSAGTYQELLQWPENKFIP